MDFSIPSEIQAMRDTILDFVTTRIEPKEAEKLVGAFKPAKAKAADAAAWVGVARAILNLDEFVTRD